MRVHKVTMSSGERYEIPEIWIMGFCRNGRTVADAIAYWHEQQVFEREFNDRQLSDALATPIDFTKCYCSSLGRSIYAEKGSPTPRCDFCTGLRQPS